MRQQIWEHLLTTLLAALCAAAIGWWVKTWREPEPIQDRPLLADLAQEAALRAREAEQAKILSAATQPIGPSATQISAPAGTSYAPGPRGEAASGPLPGWVYLSAFLALAAALAVFLLRAR